ncbi:MAG TPA: outer membrane beta-barrel protein [Chitinophagaceae bacterium]
MHKLYVLLAGLCIATGSMAQTDTTQKPAQKADTIKVGSITIIRDGKNHDAADTVQVNINRNRVRKHENVSTNWWIVDLGFANYTDKTNYASLPAQQLAPGSNADWFNLKYGKSVVVNLWLFMQRRNLIGHVVNLKYGLGLELNNYRYDDPILFNKATNSFTMDVTRHYHKDKLAADYLTVPLMLNFNFTPNSSNNKSIGLSAGASVGYLYSSRQKMITNEDGKQKIHDPMELNPFKISYVAELQLGPIKLFGSLASQSMFKKGLDQTPYTFGVRLSNW